MAEDQYRTAAFGSIRGCKIALACFGRFKQNGGGLKRFNTALLIPICD
jgi:hypothetical protein